MNRFIVVCKPLHAASLCTVSRARKQLLVLILVSVLYNLVKYGEMTVKTGWSGTYNRTVTYAHYTSLKLNGWYDLIYGNIIYMLVYFVIPLVILSVINVRLILTLKAAATERAVMSNVQEVSKTNSIKVRMTSVPCPMSITGCLKQLIHTMLTQDARRTPPSINLLSLEHCY